MLKPGLETRKSKVKTHSFDWVVLLVKRWVFWDFPISVIGVIVLIIE